MGNLKQVAPTFAIAAAALLMSVAFMSSVPWGTRFMLNLVVAAAKGRVLSFLSYVWAL